MNFVKDFQTSHELLTNNKIFRLSRLESLPKEKKRTQSRAHNEQ